MFADRDRDEKVIEAGGQFIAQGGTWTPSPALARTIDDAARGAESARVWVRWVAAPDAFVVDHTARSATRHPWRGPAAFTPHRLHAVQTAGSTSPIGPCNSASASESIGVGWLLTITTRAPTSFATGTTPATG